MSWILAKLTMANKHPPDQHLTDADMLLLSKLAIFAETTSPTATAAAGSPASSNVQQLSITPAGALQVTF